MSLKLENWNGSRPTIRLLATALVGLSLCSCDSEDLAVTIQSSDSISGHIETTTLIAHPELKNCSDIQVSLISINEDGEPVFPANSSSPLRADGSFGLSSLSSLGITKNTTPAAYLLQASGCGAILARPVTRATDQTISFGSTLLSFVIGTSAVLKIDPAARASGGDDLENLIQAMEGSESFSEAYTRLTNGLDSSFSALFDLEPSSLADASPLVDITSFPSALVEGETYEIEAVAYHWDSNYVSASKWYREETELSATAIFTYALSVNDQGDEVSYIFIAGADDGMGSVNETQNVTRAEIKRRVENKFVPVVPTLTLASAPLTRTATVYILMDTGVGMANCGSFSSLAITEVNVAPPESLFASQALACDTAGTQTLDYQLIDRVDGLKTLYFWALDDSGQISETPKTISLTFSSSAPYLGYTSPIDGDSFASSATINGTCQEPFDVEVGGTGISNPSTSVPCLTGGTFVYTVNFTPVAESKDVTISQTDLAGNLQTIPRSFVRTTP